MAQRHNVCNQEDSNGNNGRKARTARQNARSALTGGLEVLEALVVPPTHPQKKSLLDLAQGMQAFTAFAPFAHVGQGAALFLSGDGLIFEHRGDTLVVICAEDQRLVGVFIWFSELRKLAEAGKTVYHPRAETSWSEDLENKRAYVLTALLKAVEAEGGHQGVVTVIEELGHAECIRDNIKSRSQDLLTMFDQGGTHTFYVEIGGKPMEFRSGHFDVPHWSDQVKTKKEVFGIKLRAAPLGTPNSGYKVGGYVVLQHLFSKTPPTASIGAMMVDIISLFVVNGTLDEAKAAVVAIGGVIPDDGDDAAVVAEVPQQPAAVQAPAPEMVQ